MKISCKHISLRQENDTGVKNINLNKVKLLLEVRAQIRNCLANR